MERESRQIGPLAPDTAEPHNFVFNGATDHQLPTHQTKIKRTFLFKSKRWPPCLHCAPSNYYIHCVLNKKLSFDSRRPPPEVRMGKAGIDWKLVRTKLPLPILDSAKRMTTHKYTFTHKHRYTNTENYTLCFQFATLISLKVGLLWWGDKNKGK